MGLVIFGLFALYLIISIVVVTAATRIAKKKGRSARRWGIGTALVMYLLVFWDHIPTVLVHKYYCETEAGFWVYKTVDQWKAENPGVMETLVASKDASPLFTGDANNSISTYFWNSRFNYIVKRSGPHFLHRWLVEQALLDKQTNEILGRSIDFSTSYVRRKAGLSGWKFWLDNKYCTENRDAPIKGFNWMSQFRGAE